MAAAYYNTFLIVRAIASLGCIDKEQTREAGQFATAMMEADIGTPDLDYEGSRRPGGMLHKVVRWTFEKQGLYQISPQPPWKRVNDELHHSRRCGAVPS